VSLSRPPSFNEPKIGDKPRAIRRLDPLRSENVELLTRRYRCMLESLQSVDEGVAEILDEVRQAGELNQTYVMLTSDNGFFYGGEHRIRGGKNLVYEEAIRVPMVIRGPSVAANRSLSRLSVNPDLTRTILDAANVQPGRPPDGVSLFGPASGRKAISVESRHFRAARTTRYLYAMQDTGERELYDLRRDPYELRNVAGRHAYRHVRKRMEDLRADVSQCAGANCH
jgi:arylsulfatase A-like enzyme